MNPSILFAFGAMAAYSILGLLHKQADRTGCRPQQINVLLFAWSTLFSAFALIVQAQDLNVPGKVWSIAIPSGACAAAAILFFQIGLRYGKIAASWLIINLSAGIPITASIILYREKVGPKQGAALLAMFASLVFLWLERRTVERAKA